VRTNALELRAADSGTPNAPVLWRSLEGGRPACWAGGGCLAGAGDEPGGPAAVGPRRAGGGPPGGLAGRRPHGLWGDEIARIRPPHHARPLRAVLRRQTDDPGPLAQRGRLGKDRGVSRIHGRGGRSRRQNRPARSRVQVCRRPPAPVAGHGASLGSRILGVGLGQLLRAGGLH
jgi:hypothetical protein